MYLKKKTSKKGEGGRGEGGGRREGRIKIKQRRKDKGQGSEQVSTFQQELPCQNESFLLSSLTVMTRQETMIPSLIWVS